MLHTILIDMNDIAFHEFSNMETIQGECSHAFPPHIHESLCIGRINSGRAELSIHGHREVLSTGDYYVIPPYTLHTLSSVGLGRFSYQAVCYKNLRARKEFTKSVSSAKKYIENTLSECNLDTLSDTVYVSKYHLNRIFKEELGISPYQFYISQRVKRVKQGLQADLPLSDMVYNLGFCDQSHLCNTFLKHVGISPMQYTRSYRYG